MTICSDCAENKGLVRKDKAIGMYVAKCPYCGIETSLCDEIHDHKYPGQKPVTIEDYLTWKCNNPEIKE